jgi:hypothetical protein
MIFFILYTEIMDLFQSDDCDRGVRPMDGDISYKGVKNMFSFDNEVSDGNINFSRYDHEFSLEFMRMFWTS